MVSLVDRPPPGVTDPEPVLVCCCGQGTPSHHSHSGDVQRPTRELGYLIAVSQQHLETGPVIEGCRQPLEQVVADGEPRQERQALGGGVGDLPGRKSRGSACERLEMRICAEFRMHTTEDGPAVPLTVESWLWSRSRDVSDGGKQDQGTPLSVSRLWPRRKVERLLRAERLRVGASRRVRQVMPVIHASSLTVTLGLGIQRTLMEVGRGGCGRGQRRDTRRKEMPLVAQRSHCRPHAPRQMWGLLPLMMTSVKAWGPMTAPPLLPRLRRGCLAAPPAPCPSGPRCPSCTTRRGAPVRGGEEGLSSRLSDARGDRFTVRRIRTRLEWPLISPL